MIEQKQNDGVSIGSMASIPSIASIASFLLAGTLCCACNSDFIAFPSLGCEEGEPCDICGEEVFEEDVSVSSGAEYAEYGDVTWVDATLSVEGTELADLQDFSNLRCVRNFEIRNNEYLTTFSGIEQLVRIEGKWTVEGNDSLESLDGPVHVEDVLNGIAIAGNPSLASLEGLEAVRWMHGSFEVSGNDSLVEVGDIAGMLVESNMVTIEENASLSTCAIMEVIDELASEGWSGDVCVRSNLEDGCAGDTGGCDQ